MIDAGRYTSGRIALANLSAAIERLSLRQRAGATFHELAQLARLLFLRGDLLGRIADHDRAESIACEAVAFAPGPAPGLFLYAQVCGRFHRFAQADALLDQASAAGHPGEALDAERAALFQATGRYREAHILRSAAARREHSIQALGALASLLAEMGEWTEAEERYAEALDADPGPSPIPYAQLLFDWGLNAMRRGKLELAETLFAQLQQVMPQHVPARGHRAEVALAQGRLHEALALVAPLVDVSDDPEYRATHAQVLAARGDHGSACEEAQRAAATYEALLARRPEAYADHAAAFFMGIGNQPQLAVKWATVNWSLRDTPRASGLLSRALRNARHAPARAGT
jgi:tetratricopeptide (TPR) repeat protein